MDLIGTHGTSKSRWDSIRIDGFKCDLEGRRGSGAYFWAESPYSDDLAVAWYLKCQSAGTFSKDKYNTCAILTATLSVCEDEFLNIESDEIKSEFLEIYESLNIEDSNICGAMLYNYFINLMEKVLGNPISIFKVNVNPPNKPRVYPSQLMGNPACYVVRKPECISIKKTVFYSNEDLEKWKTAQELKRLQKRSSINYAL